MGRGVCIPARRADTKRQPSPEGLGPWMVGSRSSTGGCGTTLFVCSLRAKPTCPGVPWRDLQFRGALPKTWNSATYAIQPTRKVKVVLEVSGKHPQQIDALFAFVTDGMTPFTC